MFVGRERELAEMNRLYDAPGFQMLVLYGRRRVGKTTLIEEFSRSRRTLFFTAKIQVDKENLSDFSKTVYDFFDLPTSMPPFGTWDDAFDFVVEQSRDERIVLVFDEFPYAAKANPSLPSIMQIAIDRRMKGSNIYLILSGSNQGFMESEVLGRESPLFGRRTAQLKLSAFGYLDSARMLEGISLEDQVKYYSCIGGTPYYLSLVDAGDSFENNIKRLFFEKMGFLYEEPLMLLRQELREPTVYASVLGAIGQGAVKAKEIADRLGIERTAAARYIATLRALGIIERKVPFGENVETSRKGIYVFNEGCFAYWYRFVKPYVGEIEQGAGPLVADQVAFGDALSTYVGQRFEGICREWLRTQALSGRLPFSAISFGQWWGADPLKKSQTDIDAVAANRLTRQALFGECKWRESFDETAALARVQDEAPRLIGGYGDVWAALFTKRSVSAGTKRKAVASGGRILLIDLETLYEGL
ncbi:MAG: ATP-binding protein [Slackia sp.]|nr:ATP-binding protein [Slackia sp.]